MATKKPSAAGTAAIGLSFPGAFESPYRWPVPDAPRSVTVAASSCTEAGLLSTLALLQGAGAQGFLEDQATQHWLLR